MNTKVFIICATTMFATSGKNFVQVKIASGMSQGRKFTFRHIFIVKIIASNIFQYFISRAGHFTRL